MSEDLTATVGTIGRGGKWATETREIRPQESIASHHENRNSTKYSTLYLFSIRHGSKVRLITPTYLPW